MDDITSFSHRKLSTILKDPNHPHHAAAKAERDRRAMQKESKDEFEPHMMYDPKTGKSYMAKKPEDHIRMSKMGYSHDKPKTEGAMKRIATTQSNKADRIAAGDKKGLETFKKREMQKETKGAPKGYHFTRDGKLRKGDAGADGDGGAKLRSDPLDKQRSKIPPLPEKFANPAQQAAVMAKLKKSGKYDAKEGLYASNQTKRLMSPLQKARLDKEKADRDRDGKLMNVKTKPKMEGNVKSFKEVSVDRLMNEAATPAMKKAADELNSYAKKSGGIDKADFMKAAKMLSSGKAGMALIKFVDGQDTDVYEKIIRVMAKHMGKQTVEKMFKVNIREKVQVDELKKSTYGSYIKKAGPDAVKQTAQAKRHSDAGDMADKDKDMYKHYAKSQRAMDKAKNRTKGINKAVDKLTREATSLDEISKDMAGRYLKKVPASSADAADKVARSSGKYGDRGLQKKGIKTFVNRNKGAAMAVDKLTGKAKVPAEATIPDGQTAMTKRPELTNNDKDKLAKIRKMLDREKKK